MYINIRTTGDASLVNINRVMVLNVDSVNQRITATNTNRIVFATIYSGEDYLDRYNDVVAALASDLPIYDCNEKIGYWKHTSSTAHKSHAAPKKAE